MKEDAFFNDHIRTIDSKNSHTCAPEQTEQTSTRMKMRGALTKNVNAAKFAGVQQMRPRLAF